MKIRSGLFSGPSSCQVRISSQTNDPRALRYNLMTYKTMVKRCCTINFHIFRARKFHNVINVNLPEGLIIFHSMISE